MKPRFILVFLFLAQLLRATTYYVDPVNGLDSNPGTSSGAAWLTVAKINSHGLAPGDTLLIDNDGPLSGNIFLAFTSSVPTASTPVTISSYGGGPATINGGNGAAIQIQDPAFTTITNLNLIGSGVTLSGSFPNETCSTAATASLLILQNTVGNVYRAGNVIDTVTFSQGYGAIDTHGPSAATQNFDGLRISNCIVHDLAQIGIALWGAFGTGTATTANKNCRILDCQVYNIYGQTSYHHGSGFGIVVFSSQDCLIDRCLVHDCGVAQYASASNGVALIEYAYSIRGIIRRCEGYISRSPQQIDGQAFDLDAACVNCIVEYSYGHDCDGAVMQCWDNDSGATTSSGNVVHHDIFVNGGLQPSVLVGMGSIFATQGPTVGNPLFYNNACYNSKAPGGLAPLFLLSASSAGYFYNNIFCCAAGATFGNFQTVAALLGNVYNVRTGSTFSLTEASTVYTSLASLQTAGFEKLNGALVGAAGDPVFTSPGDTTVIMPFYPLSTDSAYDLGSGSVAHGAAVSVQIDQITPPSYDWHRNDNGFGETSTLSGLDSGPTNFGSVANRSLGVP